MLKEVLLAMTGLVITGLMLQSLSVSNKDSWEQFQDFKVMYKKSYGTASELEYRFAVFQETLERINRVNNDSSKRYTLTVNKFADLKFSEFASKYLNPITRQARTENANHGVDTFSNRPKEVDWRNKVGAVGAIKTQGHCGSCWAFSAVASFENAVWRETSEVVSLSEQELVDCAGGCYGNHGCDGGLSDQAFDYIKDNQLSTEQAYPYKGINQLCNGNNLHKPNRMAIQSYTFISPGSVYGLLDAIVVGVVSVSIEVQDDFMSYSSGVYHNDTDCGARLNHAVAAVGYNIQTDDPYFIVRNSWGADWGQQGYINMAVAKGAGTCGIADCSDVYPNV